jgi:DNA/RNA-binding domain of Phe-tRNA-synthetase-like protein
MLVTLGSDFLRLFPQASVHVLVVDGLQNLSEAAVTLWKDRAQQHVLASNLQREHLAEQPEFREWRQAYAKFGLKSKFRSSVEALWRRALKGDWAEIPILAVNLYCYVSILTKVPFGSYDLDRVAGDIVVRRAAEGEQFLGIGEESHLPVPPGTVIYADDGRVLCFGWNYRDSAHVCLQQNTSRGIFFADSSLASSRSNAEIAISTLRTAFEEAGCRSILSGRIDVEQSTLAISVAADREQLLEESRMVAK